MGGGVLKDVLFAEEGGRNDLFREEFALGERGVGKNYDISESTEHQAQKFWCL